MAETADHKALTNTYADTIANNPELKAMADQITKLTTEFSKALMKTSQLDGATATVSGQARDNSGNAMWTAFMKSEREEIIRYIDNFIRKTSTVDMNPSLVQFYVSFWSAGRDQLKFWLNAVTPA